MSWFPPVMDVTMSITGTDEVAARFKSADSRVRKWTHALMDYLGRRVAKAANDAAPVRKMGRLKKAFSPRFTLGKSGYSKDTTERVVVRAWKRGIKDIAYAMEFGQLTRGMQVGPYKRRRPRRAVMANGVRAGRRIPTGTVNVKAYRRRGGIAPRPILGPSFAAIESSISRDLEQGLQAAVKHSLEDGV